MALCNVDCCRVACFMLSLQLNVSSINLSGYDLHLVIQKSKVREIDM